MKEKKPDVLQKKSAYICRAILVRECTKLDPKTEQAMAEEGIFEDIKNWPGY